MQSKKGFFIALPFVLRLVLAIVAIGLLVYLLTSILGIGIQKTRVEQARATLDDLVNVIESVQEGEREEFYAQSIEDWYLIGFSGILNKPSVCGSNSCICICSDIGINDYISGCENTNLCYVFEGDKKINLKSYFPNLAVVVFTDTSSGTQHDFNPFKYHNCIKLNWDFQEISISKESAELNISYTNPDVTGIRYAEAGHNRCYLLT